MDQFQGDYISNSLSPYSPVKRDPTISFRVVPDTGAFGVPTDVTLIWTSDLGVSASINQAVGAVPISGSFIATNVVGTVTWTLSIVKLDGTIVTRNATYTAS